MAAPYRFGGINNKDSIGVCENGTKTGRTTSNRELAIIELIMHSSLLLRRPTDYMYTPSTTTLTNVMSGMGGLAYSN